MLFPRLKIWLFDGSYVATLIHLMDHSIAAGKIEIEKVLPQPSRISTGFFSAYFEGTGFYYRGDINLISTA